MSNKEPVNCTLLQKTIELLGSCGKSPATIAQETGLPIYWINSVRWKKGLDPSVNRTIKLYEHLSGKKLEIN